MKWAGRCCAAGHDWGPGCGVWVADGGVCGRESGGARGHNPLEPAQFGVPVVMGRSYENFREIVGRCGRRMGFAWCAGCEELGASLMELLTDRDAAKAMGERGRRVFEAQRGRRRGRWRR